MTNQDIFDLVNFITNLKNKGLDLEYYQFNLLLKRASYQKFKQVLGIPEQFFRGQPTTGSAYEVSQRITEQARRFKESETLSITGTLATIPAGYFYVTGINYGDNPVDILSDGQWGPRTNNSITFPSTDFPICRFFSSEIQFLPTGLSSVSWTYLKKPTEPVYAVKDEYGIKVYDSANSVELDWDEPEKQDIVSLILGDLGIITDPASVVEYANMKKIQGV